MALLWASIAFPYHAESAIPLRQFNDFPSKEGCRIPEIGDHQNIAWGISPNSGHSEMCVETTVSPIQRLHELYNLKFSFAELL